MLTCWRCGGALRVLLDARFCARCRDDLARTGTPTQPLTQVTRDAALARAADLATPFHGELLLRLCDVRCQVVLGQRTEWPRGDEGDEGRVLA